jgi:hypothetical protein
MSEAPPLGGPEWPLRRLRALITCATWLVVVSVVIVGSPDVADASAGGGADGGVIWANVQFSAPPSSGGSDPSGCRWRPSTPYDAGLGQSGEVTRTVGGVLQRLYERSCQGTTTLVWVSQPTPGQLGQIARDAVIARLPAPRPRTAPPADRAIVHSGMWFWTDASIWNAVSITAWVPTPSGVLWSRTTARPTSLVMAPGAPGSTPVSCPGPGRVWGPSDGDDTVSACTITYVHDSSLAPSGRFPAVLGIDWSISWSSSTGQAGVLAGHRTTAPVAVGVSEIQALVTDSSR